MIKFSALLIAGALLSPAGPRAHPAPSPAAEPTAATTLTSLPPRSEVKSITAGPEQIVTVRAHSSSSTRAKVGLWRRQADGSYVRKHGPYKARIGSGGVGQAREGSSRTPAGIFTLTQAFGSWADPGTRLPYLRTGPRDWWDENPSSPTYNRHVVQTASPGGASENLYYTGHPYAHAVVIDYNMHPVVPGAGSGFFLHVTQHQATAGCVAVSHAHLIRIMRWLNPHRHPVMSIGVGRDATGILHAG